LSQVFGDARRIVIARELTKLFESVQVIALGEARHWLEQDANRQRGEFVLIVEAPVTVKAPLLRAEPVLVRLLAVLSLREAVDLATELTGAPRKALYARALEIRKATNNDVTDDD